MSNDLVRMMVVVAIVYVAYQVLCKEGGLVKNLSSMSVNTLVEDITAPLTGTKRVEHGQVQDELYRNNSNVLAPPQMSNSYAPQGNFSMGDDRLAPVDFFPTDQLTASDLLPRGGGDAMGVPTPQGQLMNRNLFESGHHAGLNTQSSTLKNANLQLRSDPMIPRRDIGPWHQSTYEGDTNRRPFEIGSS